MDCPFSCASVVPASTQRMNKCKNTRTTRPPGSFWFQQGNAGERTYPVCPAMPREMWVEKFRCEAESAWEVCRNKPAKPSRHRDLIDAGQERSARRRLKLAVAAERTKPAQQQSHALPRNTHNRKLGARGLSFRAHDIPQASRRECLERSIPVPRANSLRSPPATITSGCCVTVSCFLNQMCEGLNKSRRCKIFVRREGPTSRPSDFQPQIFRQALANLRRQSIMHAPRPQPRHIHHGGGSRRGHGHDQPEQRRQRESA